MTKTVNQNNLLTLLALKAVKARYLKKQYENNVYEGVSSEYSLQVQNECQGEIWACESVAQAIDLEYYKERKEHYRKAMNQHQDSYKLTFITNTIETYENYFKSNQD